MESRDLELTKKSIDSRNLINRADANRIYGANDFILWTKHLFDGISFSSVFDVCCGTGNQLVLYAERPEVRRIAGVDVSLDALRLAGERIKKIGAQDRVALKGARMEEMFSLPELINAKFDLISCFYGLYYSTDPKKTLTEMINHLSDNGVILIVGPYGNNNESFFSLLRKHFKLPDFVIYSSSLFMEKEVMPTLKRYGKVESEYFVNKIQYPNAKALLDYWRASTFYFPEYEETVARDIEMFFSLHKEFIVEKRVIAVIAKIQRGEK